MEAFQEISIANTNPPTEISDITSTTPRDSAVGPAEPDPLIPIIIIVSVSSAVLLLVLLLVVCIVCRINAQKKGFHAHGNEEAAFYDDDYVDTHFSPSKRRDTYASGPLPDQFTPSPKESSERISKRMSAHFGAYSS